MMTPHPTSTLFPYTTLFRSVGWKVIKIWEHQVEQDLIACVKRIATASGIRSINWGAVETARKSLPSLRRRRYAFHTCYQVLLRSEEHTSELQSHVNLVCRLL